MKPNTIGLGEYSDEDLLAELEMRKTKETKSYKFITTVSTNKAVILEPLNPYETVRLSVQNIKKDGQNMQLTIHLHDFSGDVS